MQITRSGPNGQPEVVYQHEPEVRPPSGNVEPPRRVRKEHGFGAIAGGSALEVLGGAAAVVLAIIALVGYLPFFLTAIATIVIGGALLAHGAATSARWNEGAVGEVSGRETSIEVLAGAAGVLFGIIVLAHVSPLVFLPVAAIVLGGALLMAAPSQRQFARYSESESGVERATYRATQASTPMMTLAGAAAVVLGILALIHVGPTATLAMIAILVLGGALFLSGGALSARYGQRMRRHAH